MKSTYTITIYTEDTVGILNRITLIFTKRHVNIFSITASESEMKKVHKYTIVLKATEEQVKKITNQLERIIEVLRASYYTDEEVIYQEIALYKLYPSTERAEPDASPSD